MNNYKIIHDLDKLKEFIDWLPTLDGNQKFIVSLMSRKKYTSGINKVRDKTQLKRFVTDKKWFIDKIRTLEVPFGTWKLKDQPVQQESLVLYVMPNPRCMKKATKMLGKKCWDLINNDNYNLVSESLSCLQDKKSRIEFFKDFDVDRKNIKLNVLSHIFPKNELYNAYSVVETRGGYHILVTPKNAAKCRLMSGMEKKEANRWYQELIDNFEVDQAGDQYLPVPGTTQGGFVPKLIKNI